MPAKIEDGTIPTDKTILNVCYTGQTASYATSLLNLLGYDAQNLLFGVCGIDTTLAGGTNWLKQTAEDEFAGALVSEETKAEKEYEFVSIKTGAEKAEVGGVVFDGL